MEHFNPRPPCGGRLAGLAGSHKDREISIHAPRAGGDMRRWKMPPRPEHFNPRPPCGGRHGMLEKSADLYGISIHAPRAGGDDKDGSYRLTVLISIHAPRAGGDLSCGFDEQEAQISIHAPRAGGDLIILGCRQIIFYFNPRPPCGGRLFGVPPHMCMDLDFNPRPPCGGRLVDIAVSRLSPNFNPRPPCGGRLLPVSAVKSGTKISIHAPRAGGDGKNIFNTFKHTLFQSTPPVRGATRPYRSYRWVH